MLRTRLSYGTAKALTDAVLSHQQLPLSSRAIHAGKRWLLKARISVETSLNNFELTNHSRPTSSSHRRPQ